MTQSSQLESSVEQTPAAPPPIQVRQLCKQYGDHQVLKGVDLDVADGQVLTIIGPSGSGKSTLLRCMNLLEVPTSGSVRILGEEITSRNVSLPRVRRNIGMVFQQFNLFPHMTVVQNVMEGPVTALGLSRSQARTLAMDLLEKVGVAAHAEKRPSRLSGGQQQRVAIARALAMKPRVMLFDEPTSALDPELRAEVLDAMQQLAREGMTMVIVTHEMNFAEHVADQAVFVDDGYIVEAGKPEQLLNDPQSDRLRKFLGKIFWEG